MTHNADQVIETFGAAGDENKLSPLREHQLVTLPEAGEVWMTGDIHDHRTNFKKLIAAADLGNHPQRHLVLHELIHGDHFDPSGAEVWSQGGFCSPFGAQRLASGTTLVSDALSLKEIDRSGKVVSETKQAALGRAWRY